MYYFLIPSAFALVAAGALGGQMLERNFGKAVRAEAHAIDTCAREARVYPTMCQMQAVVVESSLLPPPEGEGL